MVSPVIHLKQTQYRPMKQQKTGIYNSSSNKIMAIVIYGVLFIVLSAVVLILFIENQKEQTNKIFSLLHGIQQSIVDSLSDQKMVIQNLLNEMAELKKICSQFNQEIQELKLALSRQSKEMNQLKIKNDEANERILSLEEKLTKQKIEEYSKFANEIALLKDQLNAIKSQKNQVEETIKKTDNELNQELEFLMTTYSEARPNSCILCLECLNRIGQWILTNKNSQNDLKEKLKTRIIGYKLSAIAQKSWQSYKKCCDLKCKEGKKPCIKCHGRGIVECKYGTKTCDLCKGEKTSACPKCNGKQLEKWERVVTYFEQLDKDLYNP